MRDAFIDPELDDIRTVTKKQRHIIDSGIEALNRDSAAMRTCLRAEVGEGSGCRVGVFSKSS